MSLVRGYVTAVYRAGEAGAPGTSDPAPGVMCDVQVIEPGWRGPLRHVPVMTQSGGVYEAEHWEPRPVQASLTGRSLTLEGGNTAIPLHETDGDLVIVAFLGGDVARPVIIGQLPHPGTDYPAPNGYRWWRRIAGNEATVDDDGNVTLDLREGTGKITVQTADDTTLVLEDSEATLTIGGTTIRVVDGDVSVSGVDVEVGGKLTIDGAAAAEQAVVLQAAYDDLVGLVTKIVTQLLANTALIPNPALDPTIATDLAQLLTGLSSTGAAHLASNLESD